MLIDSIRYSTNQLLQVWRIIDFTSNSIGRRGRMTKRTAPGRYQSTIQRQEQADKSSNHFRSNCRPSPLCTAMSQLLVTVPLARNADSKAPDETVMPTRLIVQCHSVQYDTSANKWVIAPMSETEECKTGEVRAKARELGRLRTKNGLKRVRKQEKGSSNAFPNEQGGVVERST